MSYKNDYVNGSPYVAQTRNVNGCCDFGIASIPCALDDSRQFTSLLITMAEVLTLMENNICFITANGKSSDSLFVLREMVLVCYYDTDNSVWVVMTNNCAFTCEKIDEYPAFQVI